MEPADGNSRDVSDSFDPAGSAVSYKNIDPSKKVQQICMSLHGKLVAKENEIWKLQTILRSLTKKLSHSSVTVANSAQNSPSQNELNAYKKQRKFDNELLEESFKTIDCMHEKLNEQQEKLFEARGQNVSLRQQLAKAQGQLKEEVVDLKTSLKEKDMLIAELMQRLKEYESPDKATPHMYDPSANETEEIRCTCSPEDAAARNNANCGDGHILDLMFYRSKSNDLENQLALLQQKSDNLEQQCKALEEEVNIYKKLWSNLKEDNETLSKILKAERARIFARESQSEAQVKLCALEMDEIKEKCGIIAEKSELVNEKYMHAKDTILQQDLYIAKLEDNVKVLEEDLKSFAGDFLFSCRDLNTKEFISILDCLETTKNNLIEHNKTLVARVEQERMANDTLREQIALQRHRVGQLEAKLCNAMHKYEESPIAVKSSIVSSIYGTKPSSSFCNIPPNPNLQTPRVDLQKALDIALENILALERKNRQLQEEKEHDAKTFECFVLNAKERLLEHIKEQRAPKLNTSDDGETATKPSSINQIPTATTPEEVKSDA